MKIFAFGCKVGLLVWVYVQLAHCRGAFDDAKLDNVAVEHYRGMMSLKPSSCNCAASCVLNTDCVSFSYDLKTRICLLRNTTLGNNDMAYAKSECHSDGCSLGFGFRCQVFRRFHPYVSESRLCENQTYVTGAKKHFSNGATTYTCEHPDFMACLNKTIRVCQCTGTWDIWTGMCGRFRWKNVAIKDQALFLPCRSWEEFKVTIRLTLQNYSEFDVSLMKGQDMVFYAYFSFQFNEQSHSISCNTFVQNTWGTEQEWQSHTLHFGRECIVRITLRRGVYSLDFDGETRCTVPESIKGQPPEYVEIENDVNVNSVEFAV